MLRFASRPTCVYDHVVCPLPCAVRRLSLQYPRLLSFPPFALVLVIAGVHNSKRAYSQPMPALAAAMVYTVCALLVRACVPQRLVWHRSGRTLAILVFRARVSTYRPGAQWYNRLSRVLRCACDSKRGRGLCAVVLVAGWSFPCRPPLSSTIPVGTIRILHPRGV
jgi:hypothetical protein